MMDCLINYILIFLLIANTIFIFYEKRNYWVSTQRAFVVYKNPSLFLELESYRNMMLKFWIWDIDKFIIKQEDENE